MSVNSKKNVNAEENYSSYILNIDANISYSRIYAMQGSKIDC